LEDLGDTLQEDFPRARRNLRKVMKSGENLDCWIWKGHVEEIHIFRRSTDLEEIKGEKHGKTPKGWSSK
jgi:hypothetical protein